MVQQRQRSSAKAERRRQVERLVTVMTLLGLIGSTAAFVIAALNDFKAVARDVGLLGILVICSTVAGLVLFVQSVQKLLTRYQSRGRVGGPRVALSASLLFLSLAGVVFSGIIVLRYFLPPASLQPLSDSPPTSAPFCYHLDKSDGSPQDRDIDVGVQYRGYMRQVFTATGTKLGAVGAIISRERRTSQDSFSEGAIGKVRVAITKLDRTGADLEPVPIAELDSGRPLDPNGIVVTAGPNHRDTVVKLESADLEPGSRYAFTFTNEEPGAVLAFSLRPRGNGNPVTLSGEVRRGGIRTLDNRALAGFACSGTP